MCDDGWSDGAAWLATGCWGVWLSVAMMPAAIHRATVALVSNRCAAALAKQQAVQRRTLMKLRISQTIANEARGCSQLKETLGTETPSPGTRSAGTPHLRQHPGPAGPFIRTFMSPKTPRRVRGGCEAGHAVVLKTVYP